MAAGGFAHRDLLDVDAKSARHRGTALELLQPLQCQRQRDRSHAAEPSGYTRLGLEGGIELSAIARKFCHIGGGAQLANEPRSMPSRAAGELFPLEQDDIAPAE